MRSIALIVLTTLLWSAPLTTAPLPQVITLITVEKAKREMTLWHNKDALKTYRIALGGNPSGHKQSEGDSRTPEGHYIIDARNPNSSFHLSLHISYPNRADTRAARSRGLSPGGAIMIHGTPEGLTALNALGFYRDWTAGCLAVSNSEIEEIFSSVRIGTPIVIRP